MVQRGARLNLDEFLPYRLSIVSNTISGAIARLYEREYDLTIPEWRIMAVLGPDAPLSAKGVAARTRMDKVQVSRAVARLLDKGLLTRRTAPDDKRRSVLSLSARGHEVYAEVAPRTTEWEQELLSRLSRADRAELDRLLAKLQRVADEMAQAHSP